MAETKLSKREMKKFIKEVADKIKACREKKGMTQRQVAKKAGIFQQQYARIEGGKCNFTIATLFRIAYAMGVTVSLKIVDVD